MVAYVLSKIGSTLYAGAIVLEVITGIIPSNHHNSKNHN